MTDDTLKNTSTNREVNFEPFDAEEYLFRRKAVDSRTWRQRRAYFDRGNPSSLQTLVVKNACGGMALFNR